MAAKFTVIYKLYQEDRTSSIQTLVLFYLHNSLSIEALYSLSICIKKTIHVSVSDILM